MKRHNLIKRVLCVIISIALVVGMITISEPNQAQASDTENLIENGGFDTTEGWINNSNVSNPIEVSMQQAVQDKEVREYISNGDFESGNADQWGSVHSLPAAIVEENGNKVLKISNVTNGKVFHVLSGLTAGETYQISFNIKGSSDISYHLFCGDEGLSNAEPFYTWKTATTTWTTHEMSYTVPTGNAGHLVFQCVGGSGEMYLDNFSVSQEKVKTELTNVISNSDFESGNADQWGSVHSLPAAIVEENGNKVLKISNVTNGKVFHVLSGLTAGETYQISFNIKGSSDISYHLFCGDEGLSNAEPFYTWKTATTTWTTHEMSYTVPTGNAGHLVFQCVGGCGEIFIDDFVAKTEQVAGTYTEGIGTCLDTEPDNVLVMKNMTEVTYPVAIQSGKTYEYSFAVKTDAKGSGFAVHFTAGENAIWNHNSETENATDWDTISGAFTATSDADSIQFVKMGEGIVFLDDVSLTESTAVQPELQSVEISFDNYNGGWYFTVDDITKIPGGYYKVPIKIDDSATADVIIEYPQSWYPNGLAIWGFTNYGGTTPTTSFEIAADAVMTPIDPNTGVEDTSKNGVVISNTLRVVCTDGVWQEYDSTIPTPPPEIPTINLGYKMVEVDNSWYFSSSNISDVTGSYYKTTVKVDDTEFEVPLEKTADGFVIWVNFFGLIDTTKQAPNTKLEIVKDTLLQQIDPNTTGWSIAMEDGQTLKVAEDLAVVKTETGWEVEGEQTPPDGPGQDEPIEPVIVTLGNAMGLYNPGTEHEVFSVMISGPDEIKTADITAAGILNADGTDGEHVVYFPGNGEVFFYTDGATNTLLISKDSEFISIDGTIVKFDKNYEIDLIDQIIYEQGSKPVEKDPIDLEITFDKIVNDSFMFTWMMDSNQKPEAGFYRADAVIDGEEKEVLIEYFASDNAFFIYPHCFNGVPVDGREGYPTESFELKKGTKLTPVLTGTWAKDIEGQSYTLTRKVSVIKENESWFDTDYKEELSKQEPLEVKIVFDCVKGSAAIFRVVLPNGKEIDDLYGDWTTARGVVMRGIKEVDAGSYSYTSEIAAYSITGNMFYMDGLRLHEIDALQINAGTILYADATCISTQPIKITNQVRLIRDANDEWVIDKKFTTDYELVTDNDNVSGNQSQTDSSEEQKDVVSEQKEDIISPTEEDKNYAKGNIQYHNKLKHEETNASTQNNNTPIIVIGIASGISLVLLCVLLIIANKKRKNKQEQGD